MLQYVGIVFYDDVVAVVVGAVSSYTWLQINSSRTKHGRDLFEQHI